jgi:hypothetical protein
MQAMVRPLENDGKSGKMAKTTAALGSRAKQPIV